jgi:hypothetical protein
MLSTPLGTIEIGGPRAPALRAGIKPLASGVSRNEEALHNPKGKAYAGSFDSTFAWINGTIDSAQRHTERALGKAMLAYSRYVRSSLRSTELVARTPTRSLMSPILETRLTSESSFTGRAVDHEERQRACDKRDVGSPSVL